MIDTLLKVYRAASGQWAGIVIVGGEEVGRVAGCSSPEEVEDAAYEQFEIGDVEIQQ